MESEVYSQAPKKKHRSSKLVKRRRGQANYAPVADALLAELRKGTGTAAELFYRLSTTLPELNYSVLRNALARLKKKPWRRLYTSGWQLQETRSGAKWAAVYRRGSAADVPRPPPLGHAQAQRRYREKKRQRLAGSSIFALAASMQTSQNRQSGKGSDDVQALS